MKKILILGGGVSGRAAAALASARGCQAEVFDERPAAPGAGAAAAAEDKGVIFHHWDGGSLPAADLIVASPGLPRTSRLWLAAAANGAEMVGELEFGFRHLGSQAPPILAVTGTNGKTTTVELTTRLLEGIGMRALACGNIGLALSQVAAAGTEELDFLVVELSSFQLDSTNLTFAPLAAVVLNLAADHLDRHGDMRGYAMAKFNIFRNCRHPILPLELRPWWDDWRPTSPAAPTEPVWLDTGAGGGAAKFRLVDGARVCLDGRPPTTIASVGDGLPGAHNGENLLAAVALVDAAIGGDGLERQKDRLAATAAAFSIGECRMRIVAEKAGVRYVDDSKATNPAAVMAALRALGGGVHLILGGLDKGMDFAPLAAVAAVSVKHAYLIGEARDKIAAALGGAVPFSIHADLAAAGAGAKSAARPGDTVLLSPACASMDMFENYLHRGREFRRLVAELTENQGGN